MDDETYNQNIRTFLNLAEQRRLHWSTLIYAVLGFIVAANIAIVGYFVTAYIHEPNPAFLYIGAAISSVLIGAWRLYTHYVDNNISYLYPEIYFYENILGVPKQFGIARYLSDNVKNMSILFSSSLTETQKCSVLRKLTISRNMGRRGHFGFDIVGLLWIFCLLLASPISICRVNHPISFDDQMLFLFSTFVIAFGLVLIIWSLCISQKNPAAKVIEENIKVYTDQ